MSENIKTASAMEKNIDTAFKKIADQINPKQAKLNIIFISDTYPRNELGQKIQHYFGSQVIACTTAGEIGTTGYQEHSTSAIAFHGDNFICDTIPIKNLKSFKHNDFSNLKDNILNLQNAHKDQLIKGKTFGLLLIDGLSIKEEIVSSTLSSVVNAIPVVGGSAGDGLNFKATGVFSDGQFSSNQATLTLITTDIPFEVFKSQHFSGTPEKFVITAADPASRIVMEIDGEPAAEAYARKLGLDVSELSPKVFSKHPLALKIGNEYYVRSIQKMNEDLSLTFYCAIENGLVLTLAKQENYYEKTNHLFEETQSRIGELDACLAFECILRRLEVIDMSGEEKNKIMNMYRKHNTIGFHTYGEQYAGMHVNQTLTGVAFGKKAG